MSCLSHATGQIVWRRALGDVAGINLGTPTLGGPIVTAGGLVFIASSPLDDFLRAFDIVTGDEVWSWRLPAAGQATPMSYVWEGRQYVLIYAGGNPRSGSRLGDALVAFALR